MNSRRLLYLLAIVAATAGPTPTILASGLEGPYPIEWQGLAFEDALHELAGRLDLPYILDASVPSETAQTRIRLTAKHLDGRQALRWLARSAGLDAVVMDDSILMARPDRLPEAWRWHEGTKGGESANWSSLKDRTAAVDWVDAPLSVVIRDLPRLFSVDLVVHPEVLAKEILIHLQSPNSTLESVCGELAKSLDAEVGLYDGVIWARPAHLTRPTSAPAPAALPTIITAKTDKPLYRLLAIDRPLADWQAFKGLIARTTGFTCRLEVASGASPAKLEGRGTVGDILEGVRLLGLMSYQLQPGGENGSGTLLIQVRAANR